MSNKDAAVSASDKSGSNYNKNKFTYNGVKEQDTKFVVTLSTDLYKNNMFIYGYPAQVDRYIKAHWGFTEWVGTSKEYKNIMHTYLTDEVEPTFVEPT